MGIRDPKIPTWEGIGRASLGTIYTIVAYLTLGLIVVDF